MSLTPQEMCRASARLGWDAGSQPARAPAARRLAIIGTAGRDKTAPMTAGLWQAMLADVRVRVRPGDTLVSGGAAWADHLAVAMFLEGRVAALELFLPAPLDLQARTFVGSPTGRGSAEAANFYHARFKELAGVEGLAQLAQACARGAALHSQPPRPGYAGMFARNALVASSSTEVLAYTWGPHREPADGGTADTWRKFAARGLPREHVSLHTLHEALKPADTPLVPAREADPGPRCA